MFKGKRTKIVVIDPSFFGKNHNSLKALRDKGWVILIAPVGAIKIMEIK